MPTAPLDGQVNFGTAFAPGAASLQRAVISLTSAQLLALETTAIQVVPAPGINFTILPVFAAIYFTGGSVAYTNAGGAVQFQVGSRAQSLAEGFITTESPNTTVQYCTLASATSTAANPPTDINAPLNIAKITNNYAAGNGTAVVEVWYRIMEVPPVAPTM